MESYQIYSRLHYWAKKQTTSKVKKRFLTGEEFLNIYNLYEHVQSKSDYIFLINVIKTCKTYRHYKTNVIRFRVDRFLSSVYENCTLEKYIATIEHCPEGSVNKYKSNLQPMIEWLLSHTVHTSSLNSVSFK